MRASQISRRQLRKLAMWARLALPMQGFDGRPRDEPLLHAQYTASSNALIRCKAWAVARSGRRMVRQT